MSKARRKRRLLQLNRHTHRRGWLLDVGEAYQRAWKRAWRDLNVVRYRKARVPWRYRSRRVWTPVRKPAGPLPSVHGKIR